MEIRKELKGILGFLFCLAGATQAADSWLKGDLISSEQKNERELLKNLTLDYNVDCLFTDHQFVQNQSQLDLVRMAYHTADEMLDEGEGDNALPFIAVAERFYYPGAIDRLYDLAYSGACKDQVSPGLRQKIEDKFHDAYKQYKIKEDGDEFSALGKIYDLYWRINIDHLRKGLNNTSSPNSYSFPSLSLAFNLPSIPNFIHNMCGYEVAGTVSAVEGSEKKQSKRRNQGSELPGEKDSSESLRYRGSVKSSRGK